MILALVEHVIASLLLTLLYVHHFSPSFRYICIKLIVFDFVNYIFNIWTFFRWDNQELSLWFMMGLAQSGAICLITVILWEQNQSFKSGIFFSCVYGDAAWYLL